MGVAVITSRCGLVPLERSDGALFHAEAVLLVDDDELQVRECDRVFDQGMRADDDLDLAAGQPGADLFLFAGGGIADQQADLVRV